MKLVKVFPLLLWLLVACSAAPTPPLPSAGRPGSPTLPASRLPVETQLPPPAPAIATLTAHTPTPTSAPTLPKQTPSTTAVPVVLPSQVLIRFRGKEQALPLSCEARAAADWAGFFGVKIDELEFQNRLPVSDNPELGFVGDVNGYWGNIPPKSYGVYAGPVADLLYQYGLPAAARRGMSLEQLKEQLAAGHPVIVWVIGHGFSGTPQVYTNRSGTPVVVAAREHTVIAVGYTPETIVVQDGAWLYGRATQNFLDSWQVLGNMAVIYAQ